MPWIRGNVVLHRAGRRPDRAESKGPLVQMHNGLIGPFKTDQADGNA